MKTIKSLRKINWKYILGEIFIVTIGITIAFALNNWAEKKRNKSTEKQYIENLIVDLTEDQKVLENNVALCAERIEITNNLMPYLFSKPGYDTVMNDISKLSEHIDFNPSNVTYNTLINSGDFKVITNFRLKTAIESHYRNYEILLNEYKRQENFNKKYLADFYVKELDYAAINQGNTDFLKTKYFRNLIFSLRGILWFKMSASEERAKACEILIEELKNELNRL